MPVKNDLFLTKNIHLVLIVPYFCYTRRFKISFTNLFLKHTVNNAFIFIPWEFGSDLFTMLLPQGCVLEYVDNIG